MKQSGLSNRFSEETRHVWEYWYACLLCGMNQQDALHHIVSPSSRHYVEGKHNESVFNSCPIHNQTHPSASTMARQGIEGYGVTKSCHIGNEAYLYSDEGIGTLLNATAEALKSLSYLPNANDRVFLRLYAKLYLYGKTDGRKLRS
jgi:hypothetical protein